MLIFSCLSLTLYSHNPQKENQKTLLAHLNASHKIIAYASEAIKGYEKGKLYLDESQVYETGSGSFLSLSNGEILPLSSMTFDSMGSYLTTLGMVDNKFFKNVCKCGYEWSGGVFDVWCPRCGSTDWVTVRDRG